MEIVYSYYSGKFPEVGVCFFENKKCWFELHKVEKQVDARSARPEGLCARALPVDGPVGLDSDSDSDSDSDALSLDLDLEELEEARDVNKLTYKIFLLNEESIEYIDKMLKEVNLLKSQLKSKELEFVKVDKPTEFDLFSESLCDKKIYINSFNTSLLVKTFYKNHVIVDIQRV